MRHLLAQLGIRVAYAPDDGGAGGGGDGGASPAPTPAAEPAKTTALGGDGEGDPAPADDGKDGGDNSGDEPDDDKGDKSKSEGDDDDKGNKTDQASDPIKLSAPEGFEDYQGEFDTFATDMNGFMEANPKATVQDILSEAARRQADLVAKSAEDSAKAFSDQLDAWEATAKADKEIGGDNYDANVAVAVKAIEAFGSPELKAVLNESGLGNHPEFIRFAFKAGAQVKEAPVLTGAQASSGKSLADAMYPNG